MQNPWLKHPIILFGKTVELLPLQKEHFEALYQAAADKTLWELIPTDCSDKETFTRVYDAALAEREKGNEYPFVIYHKPTRQLIGSTRFFEIYPEHKKLEIGWTWITRPYWGTTVNFECKLLLLTYCFETLKTNRVQLKTKDTNIRSRKAIEKIGASFEGILRKDKVQDNGIPRNAAYFSILDDEWETAKAKILAQLQEKTSG